MTFELCADRLVAILLLLQRHGSRTARQLAEQLEVSQRTILRDIDSLSMSGIPVYAERGASGGFRIVEGFRVDLTGLRSPEIRSLFLRGNAGVLADLGWERDAQIAWDKLTCAIPDEQKSHATEVANRFYIDETPWFYRGRPAPCLGLLQDAVSQDRRVTITYEKPDGTVSNRRISPYALVAKTGTWYLVAERNDKMRVYRASRVKRMELSEERFDRPRDFQLEAFWVTWTWEFESTRPRYEVVLWIERAAFTDFVLATPWLTVDGDVHVETPAPEGYIAVRVTFETAEMACRHVIGFGHHVWVVDPLDLRTQVMERALKVVMRSDQFRDLPE